MIQPTTSTESQNRQVFKHLIRFGSITAIEAAKIYGIYRLSGRIYDLKQSGVKVISTIQFHPHDRRRHWAVYTIAI